MARRVAFVALIALLACQHVLALLGSPVADGAYTVVELGSLALIAARAIVVPRNRAAWTLVTAGVALSVGGDAAFTFGATAASSVLYLLMYAVLYLALAGLLRDRVRPFPGWLTIDGLLAGLTLTA